MTIESSSDYSTKRVRLAKLIGQGLSAWSKYQICSGLHDLSGEESAQLVVANLLNSTHEFVPIASARPPSWEDSQKRVDLGLVGRYVRPDHHGEYNSWLGAVEVKWLGVSANPVVSRGSLLADVVRLTTISTNNLNAKFLVAGGSKDKLDLVFDRSQSGQKKTEEQRTLFSSLLKDNQDDPIGRASYADIFDRFTNTQHAIPDKFRSKRNSTIVTELLWSDSIEVEMFDGTCKKMQFFVWQCKIAPGRKSQP